MVLAVQPLPVAALRPFSNFHRFSEPLHDVDAMRGGLSYGHVVGYVPFGTPDVMDVEIESLNYKMPSSKIRYARSKCPKV